MTMCVHSLAPDIVCLERVVAVVAFTDSCSIAPSSSNTLPLCVYVLFVHVGWYVFHLFFVMDLRKSKVLTHF